MRDEGRGLEEEWRVAGRVRRLEAAGVVPKLAISQIRADMGTTRFWGRRCRRLGRSREQGAGSGERGAGSREDRDGRNSCWWLRTGNCKLRAGEKVARRQADEKQPWQNGAWTGVCDRANACERMCRARAHGRLLPGGPAGVLRQCELSKS